MIENLWISLMIAALFYWIIRKLFKGWSKSEPYTEDGLGHNHEWDEMWHENENGNWVHKVGWVYCWVCGHEREVLKK